MKERVRAKLKECHIAGFLSWFFTRNIPNLEKWKTGSNNDAQQGSTGVLLRQQTVAERS